MVGRVPKFGVEGRQGSITDAVSHLVQQRLLEVGVGAELQQRLAQHNLYPSSLAAVSRFGEKRGGRDGGEGGGGKGEGEVVGRRRLTARRTNRQRPARRERRRDGEGGGEYVALVRDETTEGAWTRCKARRNSGCCW